MKSPEQPVTFEMMPKVISELVSQVKALNDRIDSMSPAKPGPTHRIMTIDEVSALIHKAKGTIYRMTSSGLIPCYRQGKTLIFFEDEIYAWLESDRKPDYARTMQETREYLASRAW